MSKWLSKLYNSIVDEISNRVAAKLRRRSMFLRATMYVLDTNDDGVITNETSYENFINLREIANVYSINNGENCVIILKSGHRFNCRETFDRMCELAEIAND